VNAWIHTSVFTPARSFSAVGCRASPRSWWELRTPPFYLFGVWRDVNMF